MVNSSSGDSNCVKAALSSILQSEGNSVLDNPKKTKALLLDYCSGNNKREITLLEQLLNEKVHTDLIRPKNIVPYSILSVNLTKKILDNHPFDEDLVRKGIDTLAITLGVITTIPKPQQKPETLNEYIRKDTSSFPVTVNDLKQKSFNVNFYSEPPGAEIFINGKFQGSSPLTLPLKQGSYFVSSSLSTYEDWKRDITVPDELYIRIELNKKQTGTKSTYASVTPLQKAPTPENQGILDKIKDSFK
jgi:hypothetical protein